MTKQILQIEGLDAATLLARLDSMESVINSIAQVNNTTPPPPAENEYLTRRSAARMLHISYVTLCDWTKKGLLTAYAVGNRVYYKPEEIRAAMTKKGGANV